LLPLQLVFPLQLVWEPPSFVPLQLVFPLQLVWEPPCFIPLQLVFPLQLGVAQLLNVNPAPVMRVATLNPAKTFLSRLVSIFHLLANFYELLFLPTAKIDSWLMAYRTNYPTCFLLSPPFSRKFEHRSQ